jgi:hypothetical protein
MNTARMYGVVARGPEGGHTTASLHTYKYEYRGGEVGRGGGCVFVLPHVREKGAEWN